MLWAWIEDPEWLEEDTEAVLAYLADEADRCPGCGLPRDEAHAKEAEGTYEGVAVRCHACKAREKAHSEFEKGKGDMDGLMFGLRRHV